MHLSIKHWKVILSHLESLHILSISISDNILKECPIKKEDIWTHYLILESYFQCTYFFLNLVLGVIIHQIWRSTLGTIDNYWLSVRTSKSPPLETPVHSNNYTHSWLHVVLFNSLKIIIALTKGWHYGTYPQWKRIPYWHAYKLHPTLIQSNMIQHIFHTGHSIFLYWQSTLHSHTQSHTLCLSHV